MESNKLIIKNSLEELQKVQSFIEGQADEWSLRPEIKFNLNLILEEYVTNLISYGYHDDKEHQITIEIFNDGKQLKVEVMDDAGPFDITGIPENKEIDKPLEERKIGGLGIHFIRALADEIDYQSKSGKNKLTFIKRL
jgi:anti-sigma regulatory factor (Ser/Thr protein kinase)